MNSEPRTVYGWLLVHHSKRPRVLVMVSDGYCWTASVKHNRLGFGHTAKVHKGTFRWSASAGALAAAQRYTDWWVGQGFRADSEPLTVIVVPTMGAASLADAANTAWLDQHLWP